MADFFQSSPSCHSPFADEGESITAIACPASTKEGWRVAYAVGTANGRVGVVDSEGGNTVGRIACAHGGFAVLGIALSDDGRHMVTGGADGTIAVWSITSIAAGFGSSARKAAADDTRGAHAPGDDTTDAIPMRRWEAHKAPSRLTADGYGLACFGLSADCRKIITCGVGAGGDYEVKLWNLAGDEKSCDATAHTARVTCVHFVGSIAATGAENGDVVVWDTTQNGFSFKHKIRLSGPVSALAISPDDSLLAIGGDWGQVELRDARSYEVFSTYPEEGKVLRMLFCPTRYWLTYVTPTVVRSIDLEQRTVDASAAIRDDGWSGGSEVVGDPKYNAIAWREGGNCLLTTNGGPEVTNWNVSAHLPQMA